jgi:hypothetical protein
MVYAERSSLRVLFFTAVVLSVTLIACENSDSPGLDGGVDAAVLDTQVADSETVDAPALDLPPDLPPSDTAAEAATDGSSVDGGLFQPGGTAAQIVNTCIKMATCTKIFTASECLAQALGSGAAIAPYMGCVGKGTSGCADLATCMGITYASSVCATSTGKCVGNNAVSCVASLGLDVTMDCPKMHGAGTVCVPTGGAALLVGCSSGKTCSTPPNILFCRGDKMSTCYGGKEVFIASCASTGLQCRDGACAGPDEACNGKATCEAGGLIAFCLGDYRLRMKCSALGAGFACKPSTVTGARCEKATQCDPDQAKGKETCSGSKLTVCNAGETLQVDCKALGFPGCASGSCTP